MDFLQENNILLSIGIILSTLMYLLYYYRCVVKDVISNYQQKFETLKSWYIWILGWTCMNLLFFSPFITIYFLFIPYINIIIAMYLIWMYIIDKNTPENKGRSFKFVKEFIGFYLLQDYFPMKLVKTAELPNNTTYMLASFPHGIFCVGVLGNIVGNGNRFNELFPGLEIHPVSWMMTFQTPFIREFALASGARLVSEKGILNILNGPAGKTALIVPGGIAELKLAAPNSNILVLKNRKGFVRVALKAGSPLVPVYHFNETEIYDVTEPWIFKWLNSRFGLSLKLRTGLYYTWLPLKKPITTVVGKPIYLPKVENPSQELVDEYHQFFIDELKMLFDKYKGKYDINGENATLTLV